MQLQGSNDTLTHLQGEPGRVSEASEQLIRFFDGDPARLTEWANARTSARANLFEKKLLESTLEDLAAAL